MPVAELGSLGILERHDTRLPKAAEPSDDGPFHFIRTRHRAGRRDAGASRGQKLVVFYQCGGDCRSSHFVCNRFGFDAVCLGGSASIQFPSEMTKRMPNHALHRTRRLHLAFNTGVWRAGSLSFGR